MASRSPRRGLHGRLIGDLNSRRGQSKHGGAQRRTCRQGKRALSEMFGYVGDLRSRTRAGRTIHAVRLVRRSSGELAKEITEGNGPITGL